MSERNYLWGADRNLECSTAHAYEGTFSDIKGPICMYGWNRADGYRFSILRNVETGPRCKVCIKRIGQNKGAIDPVNHPTKWV